MRQAAGERRYERAGALRRRLRRLAAILENVDGVLQASHARPRLVLAPHPVDPARADALWLAGGRLVDFGELPADPDELVDRTERAVIRAGRSGELGAHVPPEEIDELRIVSTYLASHPDLPALALSPAPTPEAVREFAQLKGSSTTRAGEVPSPFAVTRPSSGTSRRTRARPIAPNRGEKAALLMRPTTRSS
jgi:DNA polymerase-3 subunit epsilon